MGSEIIPLLFGGFLLLLSALVLTYDGARWSDVEELFVLASSRQSIR